jgi:hypothetical protein
MVTFISKLPIKARYQAILQVSGRLPGLPGSHAANLVSFFGTCDNTVRSALAWRPGVHPLGKLGAPELLQDHHKLYIEARTLANRTITGREALVTKFPDLERQQTLHLMRSPTSATCYLIAELPALNEKGFS